ncbi:hypothetical protein K435DRAFT_234732 [Dendrothele bispora CBS 962.96]|uniref:Uncharacterized protein n=1 Tax=Dendrothele bispora (strain CBS 962.96) TaxID=1314807 RepID=A0A4S8LPW0_DENBC|nr:hypothetical protein K435DRAFT_234732 [Dendrothele bispora CBS 962.96]
MRIVKTSDFRMLPDKTKRSVGSCFTIYSTLRLWLIWNWQRRWEGTGAGFGMKKFTYLRDKHTEMYLVHYYTFYY